MQPPQWRLQLNRSIMKIGFRITEARVFVSTAPKQRSGKRSGDWLELIFMDDMREFHAACREINSDSHAPYLITHYQNLPETLMEDSPNGGYRLADNFFIVRDALIDLLERETYPFSIWCRNGHYDLSIDDTEELISDFRKDYRGQFSTEESFARSLVQQRHDLSDFALRYFDYAGFTEDVFTSDYYMECNHVFYNRWDL